MLHLLLALATVAHLLVLLRQLLLPLRLLQLPLLLLKRKNMYVQHATVLSQRLVILLVIHAFIPVNVTTNALSLVARLVALARTTYSSSTYTSSFLPLLIYLAAF